MDTLDEDLEYEGGNGLGFGVGLLVGMALGAGIALLYAPDKGRVTRRRLRRQIEQVRDRVGEEIQTLDRKTRDIVRRR